MSPAPADRRQPETDEKEKMMTERKALLDECAERQRDRAVAAARYIWQHPETGYREWQTNAYLKKEFESLEYQCCGPEKIPGFYIDIDTGKPGPKVLTFGELDALPMPNHPNAVNGNAHACGHFVQCATVLGLAGALREPGVLDDLCGSIRIMLVPAEEAVEPDYRKDLIKKGIIRYQSGKREFMSRGYMDDVDLAFMFHTTCRKYGDTDFVAFAGNNGIMSKTSTFKGKASHAAANPQAGINALQAVSLALQAMNAQRETFPGEAQIRLSSIIDKGGVSIGTIPDEARIQTSLRAANIEDILETNDKANRAIVGAAFSMKAEVEIDEELSYYPLHNDTEFMNLAQRCITERCGQESFIFFNEQISSGSTDMGELCTVMPVIHPLTCSATKPNHDSQYQIVSDDAAIMNPIKASLYILDELLKNGAENARKIIDQYRAPFSSIKEYLEADKAYCRKFTALFWEQDNPRIVL